MCHRSFRRFMLYCREYESEELSSLLDNPDSYMNGAIACLKLGNSATVGLIELNGRRLVLKRYNIKDFGHRLKRAIQPSRAAISWLNAHSLKSRGIPSVSPVGMVEERYGPFRSRAYFVAEEVVGPDAFNYFTSSGGVADQRETMAQALVDLIVQMGRAGFVQTDTKAKNFVVSSQGPVLVDLDGVEQFRWSYTFQRAFDNCWRPLMASWKHYPEIEMMFHRLLKQAGIDYPK